MRIRPPPQEHLPIRSTEWTPVVELVVEIPLPAELEGAAQGLDVKPYIDPLGQPACDAMPSVPLSYTTSFPDAGRWRQDDRRDYPPYSGYFGGNRVAQTHLSAGQNVDSTQPVVP